MATLQLEAYFQDVLDSMPDAVVIADRKGAIVLVNRHAERMFGYARGEMLGQPVEVLMPAKFRGGHVDHRTKYFHEPRTRSMGVGLELMGQRHDGTSFPVEISLSPLKTKDGEFAVSAIRDITERKQSEELYRNSLQEANRLKSEFLANMSHELRTPLNGIIGFSEFLIDGKAGKLAMRQTEHLNDILNSGRHLLQIINDVLDLTKIEAGKVEVNWEPCSVRRVVDEACAGIAPMAEQKRITVKKTVGLKKDTVTLDAQKFRQILYNLLSNAVKFTPEDGQVEIIASQSSEGLVLSVKDTGIGIKSEDLSRLFKEFEQLDSSLARRYGGTGLGLALVKKLVELQDGRVTVQSEVGQGSVFTVTIPEREA